MQPTSGKKTPLTFDTIAPGRAGGGVEEEPRRHHGEVSASDLRGRGGAGFPTGMKWNLAAAARGATAARNTSSATPTKASPARSRTASSSPSSPDLVFEGMTIAARAIGAAKGIVYLRGEYSYLRPHLEAVLHRTARGPGCSGADILGSRGVHIRHRHPDGRGRLRLRRGDRAHRVARRTARRAAQPAAVPGRHRVPGPADGRQQRRDAGLGDAHPGEGRRVVQEPSAPRSRPAASSSASPATARGPASTSSRSGSPWRNCSKKVGGEGAKAVQVGGASGAVRAAVGVRPAPSPSRTLRPAGRSSCSGRSATCCSVREELPRVLRRGVVRTVHAVPRGERQAARGVETAGARGVLHRRI